MESSRFMNTVGSNSIASQIYNGIQSRVENVRGRQQPPQERIASDSGFSLPSKATPRGDWVLSENANPQSFDAGAPRGSYLNVVV